MTLDQRMRELVLTVRNLEPVALERLPRGAGLTKSLSLAGEQRQLSLKLLRTYRRDHGTEPHLTPLVSAAPAASGATLQPLHSFSTNGEKSEIRETHRLSGYP